MFEKLSSALIAGGLEGLPIYPVHSNKVPACPHGHKDATSDLAEIVDLLTAYPAPLVGVATGAISGIDVLDIDLYKHPEAFDWFDANTHRLPNGQVHNTRNGGLHVLFKHHPGLRCSTARPVLGVDVRADGGGIIWWPVAGYEMTKNGGPSIWPQWLLDEILPPPAPPVPKSPNSIVVNDDYIRGALDQAFVKVSNAPPGARNSTLNAEVWSLLRFHHTGKISADEIASALATAALNAGLGPAEIKATLISAMRARGV